MPYYIIRDIVSGEMVLRRAEATWLGPALYAEDQHFADKIVLEIQEACRYFYEVDPPAYDGCPEIEGVSDEEVDTRIKRIDQGENTRESDRRKNQGFKDHYDKYPLLDLPFSRKRALIERVERLKNFWEFEHLTDEEGARLWEERHPKVENIWEDPRLMEPPYI